MSDYVFHFKVIDADPSGYYHPRWDRALPVTVHAPDSDTAYKRVFALMGDAPERGWVWRARLDKVEPSCCTKVAPHE